MSSDSLVSRKKTRIEAFGMEDFGGNRMDLPCYEVFSSVETGYRETSEKEFKYKDYVEESREILENARIEAEKIKKTAFDEGFQNGETEGLRLAEKECREKMEEFGACMKELLGGIESFWDKLLEDNRESIMRLVVGAVKVVVCGEVKTNPNVILNVLRKIFRRVRDCQEVRLWVNPDDLKTIREKKKEILESLGSKKKIIVTSDPGLKRGGCRVKVENQGIEAGIETMLKEMEKNLLGEFS